MSKIPFKFRGKRKDNGEYVYGVPYAPVVMIGSHEIDPHFQRLIGYDDEGNEIYDGDGKPIDDD